MSKFWRSGALVLVGVAGVSVVFACAGKAEPTPSVDETASPLVAQANNGKAKGHREHCKQHEQHHEREHHHGDHGKQLGHGNHDDCDEDSDDNAGAGGGGTCSADGVACTLDTDCCSARCGAGTCVTCTDAGAFFSGSSGNPPGYTCCSTANCGIDGVTQELCVGPYNAFGQGTCQCPAGGCL